LQRIAGSGLLVEAEPRRPHHEHRARALPRTLIHPVAPSAGVRCIMEDFGFLASEGMRIILPTS
jgi:hypothetical protein